MGWRSVPGTAAQPEGATGAADGSAAAGRHL